MIIASKIILHKVLYVSSFKYNFISIQRLSMTLPKSIIYFTETSCILQAPLMRRPLEIGEARNGLFFIFPKHVKNNSHSDVKCDVPTHDALSAPTYI